MTRIMNRLNDGLVDLLSSNKLKCLEKSPNLSLRL